MTLCGVLLALSCGHSPEKVEARKYERRCAESRAAMPKDRPHPLPKTRRRLSETTPATHAQPFRSYFLKLPAEIRTRYNELVHSGEIVHLSNIRQRMISRKLGNPETLDGRGQTDVIIVPSEFSQSRDRLDSFEASENALALVQTSRVIYAESIPFLYSNMNFSMSSLLVLIYLHDLVLLPQRFKQIHYLYLHWSHEDSTHHRTNEAHRNHCPQHDSSPWERFWEIVAGMELLSLTVWIDFIGPQDKLALDSSWVRPMLEVKGVENVGIRIQHILGAKYERPQLLERRLEKLWTSK